MCLAVPHTIEEIMSGNRAVAVTGAVRMEIRTDLLENPAPGDTVLVHAGFAAAVNLRAETGDDLFDCLAQRRSVRGVRRDHAVAVETGAREDRGGVAHIGQGDHVRPALPEILENAFRIG